MAIEDSVRYLKASGQLARLAFEAHQQSRVSGRQLREIRGILKQTEQAGWSIDSVGVQFYEKTSPYAPIKGRKLADLTDDERNLVLNQLSIDAQRLVPNINNGVALLKVYESMFEQLREDAVRGRNTALNSIPPLLTNAMLCLFNTDSSS